MDLYTESTVLRSTDYMNYYPSVSRWKAEIKSSKSFSPGLIWVVLFVVYG
jgi:hypothetical protein